jgi:hypothetical protein
MSQTPVPESDRRRRVRAILHAAIDGLPDRLDDAATDVGTVAEQLRQTAELALAELRTPEPMPLEQAMVVNAAWGPMPPAPDTSNPQTRGA